MSKHPAGSDQQSDARRQGEQDALHVRNAVVYVLGANVAVAVICITAAVLAWLFR